jgi:hypothetical protein
MLRATERPSDLTVRLRVLEEKLDSILPPANAVVVVDLEAPLSADAQTQPTHRSLKTALLAALYSVISWVTGRRGKAG